MWTMLLEFINLAMYLSGLFFLSRFVKNCDTVSDQTAKLDIPGTTFAEDLPAMSEAALESVNKIRCVCTWYQLCMWMCEWWRSRCT